VCAGVGLYIWMPQRCALNCGAVASRNRDSETLSLLIHDRAMCRRAMVT
jgi:hypothetical protein